MSDDIRPGDWRPIETVPKDGRSFMVWIAHGENGPHCFAPVSITSDGGWWDDSTGDQLEPIRHATNWTPLPNVPVKPLSHPLKVEG